ncbi:MAG: hypothetical protein KBS79_01420, partial [Lachnospiraceae bacterium]|nr:hypothetical protein [Candidatus Minthocola equi]
MDKKKTIIAVISFVLVCLIALGIYFEVKPTADKTIKYKYVTVEVYYQGQLAHRVKSATSKEYLADFLVDVGIVAEEEKSFFSTVIGIKADYSV